MGRITWPPSAFNVQRSTRESARGQHSWITLATQSLHITVEGAPIDPRDADARKVPNFSDDDREDSRQRSICCLRVLALGGAKRAPFGFWFLVGAVRCVHPAPGPNADANDHNSYRNHPWRRNVAFESPRPAQLRLIDSEQYTGRSCAPLSPQAARATSSQDLVIHDCSSGQHSAGQARGVRFVAEQMATHADERRTWRYACARFRGGCRSKLLAI